MESASVAYPARGIPAQDAPPKPRRKAGIFDEMGELVVFSLRACRALPGTLRYFSEVMRINAIVTRRATFLVFVLCGFLGFSASNFGFFFLRSIGASDFVGILPGLITPRQIAPQAFGYAFAGSVCCAFAAELGSARIQEEIDAYEAQGIDPMQLLVGTRILATLMFVPLAAAVAMLGNFVGSYLTVVVVLQGNSSQQFIDTFFSIFPAKSILFCMIEVGLVAIQCVFVACYYGMRGVPRAAGPTAVGASVARSLGVNLVLLHFVFSLAALVFFGGSLGVPIGG